MPSATSRPDLLRMSTPRALMLVAGPMVATGLLKTTYFLTDSFYVGRLGSEALSALGGSAFGWWIVAQLTALAGTGVRSKVAQYSGAGDDSQLPTTTVQGLWVGAVIWMFLLAFAWPFRHLYFDILGFNSAGAAYQYGCEFLGASLIGAGALVVFGVVNAAFQGIGDTKTGMKIAAISALLNVALDPLFIWGWGPFPAFGIAGAAWSTALCNAIGAAIGLWVLSKRGVALRFAAPKWLQLRELVRIGGPVSLGGIGFSGIYVVLGRIITPFGEHQMAALGIGHRLESLSYMVCVGFTIAATTLVGHHVGAKDKLGASRAAHTAVGLCIAAVVPLSLALYVFAESFFQCFTTDAVVISAGVSYLRVQAVVQIWMAMEAVYEGAFTGTGDTMPTFWVVTLGTGARIPLALALVHWLEFGVVGVWYAIALTTVIKGMVLWAWFRKGRWMDEPDRVPI